MQLLPAPLVFAFSGCLCASDPGTLVPRTVTEDPSLPAIEVNGTHLHAEAFGEATAPILLALHGGPGVDYRSMTPLARLADDGYRVILWDQRGTGLSERHDGATIHLDTYWDDLQGVIDHYTVSPDQPIVFIGHSWGAMYATAYIDSHGDLGGRIRGAVLSEPGAFTEAQLEVFLAHVRSSLSVAGRELGDAEWAYRFMSAGDHERADYLQTVIALEGLPQEHHDPNNPKPMWRAGAVVNRRLLDLAKTNGFDWTQHLSAFTHPVLFLRGDRNEACTLEQQQQLASAYPDATIQTMVNAGHEMIWERSDEYLAGVRAYLNRIGVAGVVR